MTGPDLHGLSLGEAIRALEDQGFRASYLVEPDGNMRCLACQTAQHADAFPMLAFGRVEGASDPADENLVAGVQCPTCGARGTVVLPYGARASRRSSEVLSHMHHQSSVSH